MMHFGVAYGSIEASGKCPRISFRGYRKDRDKSQMSRDWKMSPVSYREGSFPWEVTILWAGNASVRCRLRIQIPWLRVRSLTLDAECSCLV